MIKIEVQVLVDALLQMGDAGADLNDYVLLVPEEGDEQLMTNKKNMAWYILQKDKV